MWRDHGRPPERRAPFGVPVRVHFTLGLVLGLVLVAGIGGELGLVSALALAVGLIGSIALHEAGHVLVARRYGVATREIVLTPVGGSSRLQRRPTPQQELRIALAGPAVSLMVAALLLALPGVGDGLASGTARDRVWLGALALGNLLLGTLNLLPAPPFDGGRVLRAILAERVPPLTAARLTTTAGRVLAAGLALAGLASGQVVMVAIALVVWIGTVRERVAGRGRALTAGVRVREAMVTDFRTLPHGASLRSAAELLLSTSQRDFPVVAGASVIGLLSRGALLHAMSHDGPDGFVAGAMERAFQRVAPDADLGDVMGGMGGGGRCRLVMEGERLLGLLTAENVAEFILLREARAAHRGAGDDVS